MFTCLGRANAMYLLRVNCQVIKYLRGFHTNIETMRDICTYSTFFSLSLFAKIRDSKLPCKFQRTWHSLARRLRYISVSDGTERYG